MTLERAKRFSFGVLLKSSHGSRAPAPETRPPRATLHANAQPLLSPLLSLSLSSPPRQPIKARDDDDGDEERGGECMSMAQENSCTEGEERIILSQVKDPPKPKPTNPNPTQKRCHQSPITNQKLALNLCSLSLSLSLSLDHHHYPINCGSSFSTLRSLLFL
ncbi:hypothetical protein ACJRO7_033300 [Eucalyptus globulus]|uniref:Uncharacterized protein n=1 Tax=Eucalyptus globulus TaxID=34317 RepID=A0ABD3JWI5_EUCGL